MWSREIALKRENVYKHFVQDCGTLKQRTFYPKHFSTQSKNVHLAKNTFFLNEKMLCACLKEPILCLKKNFLILTQKNPDYPPKEKSSYTYPKIINFSNEKNFSHPTENRLFPNEKNCQKKLVWKNFLIITRKKQFLKNFLCFSKNFVYS